MHGFGPLTLIVFRELSGSKNTMKKPRKIRFAVLARTVNTRIGAKWRKGQRVKIESDGNRRYTIERLKPRHGQNFPLAMRCCDVPRDALIFQ